MTEYDTTRDPTNTTERNPTATTDRPVELTSEMIGAMQALADYAQLNHPIVILAFGAARALQDFIDERYKSTRPMVNVTISVTGLSVLVNDVTVWDSYDFAEADLTFDRCLAVYRKEIESLMEPFTPGLEFQAFMECSDEIQNGIRDMVNIVNDPDASEDEKHAASVTIAEALFPTHRNGPLGDNRDSLDPPDPWYVDPAHPIEDWRMEVANDETRLGYKQWCERRIEIAIEERESDDAS